jgi:RNA polymerase sigma factor (sigma-70 family)
VDAGEPPDAFLVRQTVAGDAEAFAVLYRRHAGAVHRVVAATVRDREVAADLTQDVFARAIEALADLREPERFRPWVLTIARNCAIDQTRGQPRPLSLDDDGAAEPADPGAEPGELAELANLVQRVRGCIAGLSARDAAVLALVTQLGYSPVEVAGALAITPGAAKVVLHRARRRLRSAIALTLLTENQAAACPVFRDAFAKGRLNQAGAHVATCPVCRAAVNDDVELYAAQPKAQGPGSSRPTTRIPDRANASASSAGSGVRSVVPNPLTSAAP